MVRGWKLLTVKERNHLRESKIYYTDQLETTLKWQREHPGLDGKPLCWDCYIIARKLKM